jgi:pilus assembly protein Flp/PilA
MTHAPLFQIARRFFADEQAASAIEYAMIAAGIAAAVVGAVNATGISVKGMYDSVANAMQ